MDSIIIAVHPPISHPPETVHNTHNILYTYILCVCLSHMIRVWFLIMCAYHYILIYIYTPFERAPLVGGTQQLRRASDANIVIITCDKTR